MNNVAFKKGNMIKDIPAFSSYVLDYDSFYPTGSNQQLMYEQGAKTREYTTGSVFFWDDGTNLRAELSYTRKITIIEKANEAIVGRLQDLDPVIASIVSKNFKSLIWN